jgi:lipid A 3-O-deacylase
LEVDLQKYLLCIPALLVIFSTTENVLAAAIQNDAPGSLSEIRTGISKHDAKSKHEDGFDINADLYFKSPDNAFFKAIFSPRPIIGISIHSEGITHQLYTGLTWNIDLSQDVFITLGVGGGVHTGELESDDPDELRLGSRALFRYSGSLGFRLNECWNLSVYYDHMSNAALADPNNGLDKIGVQLGYNF